MDAIRSQSVDASLPFALPARVFSWEEPVPAGTAASDPLLESLLLQEGLEVPLSSASGGTLSFGLEVEFTPTRNPNIVLDYRPFDLSESDWQRKDWKTRVEFLGEWKYKMFSVAQERPVFLEKMSHAPEALPQQVSMEPNGVFELRTPPLANLREVGLFLRAATASYGPAQLQGHVVFKPHPLPGLTGFTIFEADRAMLVNLADDWEAFEKEKREPASHFVSAFLAPLNFDMAVAVGRGERDLAAGSAAPHAPKYLYAPALRQGSIYGSDEKVGIEVRQWDFPNNGAAPLAGRAGLLFQSLCLTAGLLASEVGFGNFARFTNAPLCRYEAALERILSLAKDSECRSRAPGLDVPADWEGLWGRVGTTLSARNGKSYRHDPRMPFLQPFRNWAGHPFLAVYSGPQRLAAELLVQRATREYLLSVWMSRDLQGDDLLNSLRRAVAQWSVASGLGDVARKWGV